MLKQFAITVTPVEVPVAVNPLEYRIDFTGPADVPALHMPYNDGAPAPATADFATDGDYVASAGLYDDAGGLLGTLTIANFNVLNPPVTKTVQAVGGLTITDA